MRWMLLVLSISSANILGCGPKGGSIASAGVPPVTAGTTWRIDVPNGDPDQTWVVLLGNGELEYTQVWPTKEFQHDGTDHWWVKGDLLQIEWTNGYSLETYPLVPGAKTLEGTKRSESWGDELHPCTITFVR